MSTLEIIITQLVIAFAVVALYHLWSSRRRAESQGDARELSAEQSAIRNPQSAIEVGQAEVRVPPALNLNPNLNLTLNLNPNLNLPSVSPAPAASIPTPPEIIAAIAAAITVVLGPHRVVAIQQITAPVPEVNVWALEGRMKHFMSHKVR